MKTTTRSTARIFAVLVSALAALAIAAPLANAGNPAPTHSAAPHVHWFHWHGSHDARHLKVKRFRTTAVIGLKRMRDLESLRAVYGLDCVRELPSLRAAVVRVAGPQLRALLAHGPFGSAHPLRVGARADEAAAWTCRTIRTSPRSTNRPASPTSGSSSPTHVDRALKVTKGDPHIVVGVIDTGVNVVPDLKGKIDSIWTVNPDGSVVQVPLEQGQRPRSATARASRR